MKRYLYFFTALLCMTAAQSQELSDAMQYAQDNLNGTSRFRAMGGAFGALGGDFSSLNVNPAGSAFFINDAFSLTLTSINTKNKAGYFGTNAEKTDNTFDLNQAGAAWVYNNSKDQSGWRKIALAMNYESTTNFDNTIYAVGHNPTQSVAGYFSGYGNGYAFDDLKGDFSTLNYAQQQAALGLAANIIGPVTANNATQYQSLLTGNGNFYQQNSVVSSGYNGKISFNMAASYKDRLYFGLNLNSHFSDYTKYTRFYEDYADAPGHDATTGVQNVIFSNELQTYGSGFSFQAGAIVKVVNGLRVGLSYESPTWYRLTDKLRQVLAVDCPDCATTGNQVYYENQVSENDYPTYRLRTPGKFNGSIAYIFGKSGLLSFDYTLKDYTKTKFRDAGYGDLNTAIGTTFDRTNEFRVGGEYRIYKWSLRGGYRFEESPYKDNETIGNLNSYSGGLGYSFGDTKVDLSYTLAKRDYNQAFFARGLTDAAAIRSRNDNVSLTIIFEMD